MNMRREAMLWSVAITAAVALGLVVVWAAIALAFRQLNFMPLYYVAASYSQDDYSAEGVNSARLNPLDPSLEQEVIFEDKTSGIQAPHPKVVLPAAQPLATQPPAAQPPATQPPTKKPPKPTKPPNLNRPPKSTKPPNPNRPPSHGH